MNIGVLSTAFGNLTLSRLATATHEFGFTKTQLNLIRIDDVDSRPGKLSPGLANFVAEQFERHRVKIPVLGCYTNLIHPDKEQREAGIRRFKDHLRFARDFGASVVATETGTQNPNNQFHSHEDNQSEANWQLLRGIIGELAEEAEKWGIHLALEGATKTVVNTPERMQRMLEEVPSSSLGIVMDPCNYIDTANMDRQCEVMDDAFARLGNRILLAHAKDFRVTNGKMTQPAAGTGELNYPHYLRQLVQNKPFGHLFLEHLRPDQMYSALGLVSDVLQTISNEGEKP